jgi:hypothetical protein
VLFLAQRRWAGGGHLREGGLDGQECVVFGSAEERRELPLMDVVMGDLLVLKPGGAEKLVRPELMRGHWTLTRIGAQLPVLGQPLTGDAALCWPAEPTGGASDIEGGVWNGRKKKLGLVRETCG